MRWSWALTQFMRKPDGELMSVAGSYGSGCMTPHVPERVLAAPADESGNTGMWGLMIVRNLNAEAAGTDPRVRPYNTVWDPLTPETVEAYQAEGAREGMMLCQLLAILAASEPAYKDAIALAS